MNNIEIREEHGKQYAVIPMDDYTSLLQKLEMMEDVRAFDEAIARQETALPDEVWDAIEAGIGSGIAAMLAYRHMTQSQLAELSGVKQPYISAIIRGQKPGSIDALRRICSALNITMDDLVSTIQ